METNVRNQIPLARALVSSPAQHELMSPVGGNTGGALSFSALSSIGKTPKSSWEMWRSTRHHPRDAVGAATFATRSLDERANRSSRLPSGVSPEGGNLFAASEGAN